jgi:5-methylcytosine-specific restriction endonuclease McrA
MLPIVNGIINKVTKFVAYLGKKRSPQWSKVRAVHLKKENHCRYCGHAEKLEAHHIKPFHLFPKLELDPKNLITLCEDSEHHCHLNKGHLGSWKKYNPYIRRQCKY